MLSKVTYPLRGGPGIWTQIGPLVLTPLLARSCGSGLLGMPGSLPYLVPLEMRPLGQRRSLSCTFQPKQQPLEWFSVALAFRGIWVVLGGSQHPAEARVPMLPTWEQSCGWKAVCTCYTGPPRASAHLPEVRSPGSAHCHRQSKELGCTRPGRSICKPGGAPCGG